MLLLLAWSASSAFSAIPKSVAAIPLPSTSRCSSPRCGFKRDDDPLVRNCDAGVLVGYGVVQALVDQLLLPFATAQPELFTQDKPVDAAPLQGLILAALWVGITTAVDGYRPEVTRVWPDMLKPLVIAWAKLIEPLDPSVIVRSPLFRLKPLPVAPNVMFPASTAGLPAIPI